MDPLTLAAIGSVAAPVLGGIIGGNSAKKQARAAADARNQALMQYANMTIPTVEEQSLDLLLPELQGQLNPEMQQIQTLQESQQVQDPVIKEMQMKALQEMAGIGKGGLREEDLAAFREMRRNVEGANQANQEKILQDMQRRGTLDSGMSLAAQLQANQSATDRLSSGGDKLASEAATRALQALAQTSDMGSQITNQNFKEQAARDAVNEFNTRNRQSIEGQNVGARNQAQATNLGARQQVADARVGLQNEQQKFNKGLQQTNFNNRIVLADRKAGQYGSQAQAADQNAANTAQQWANIGSGVGGMLASFGKK